MTCQICGRDDIKVGKDGTHSKHGYRVAFGWHSGSCYGSRAAPSEVSCDRLKSYLEMLLQQRDRLGDRIAGLEAGTAEATSGQGRRFKTVQPGETQYDMFRRSNLSRLRFEADRLRAEINVTVHKLDTWKPKES